MRQLREEHLLFLIKRNRRYLVDIFEGKTPTRRHIVYKNGGKDKINLKYDVTFGAFDENQQDIITGALIKFFCPLKTGFKYFDYTMKVMLPEIMIKIYIDTINATYSDAEYALNAEGCTEAEDKV